MKNLVYILSLFVLSGSTLNAGVLIAEGNYQGKDLYIQNPFLDSGVGFCVYEVIVNGETSVDEVNSSAFAVDLAVWKLDLGDPVVVKIKYKDGCSPKVINPEVLKPHSTYELVSSEVNSDGVLKWSTKNETGQIPYIIEQYKWNKWVKLGEVDGKGSKVSNEYSFKIIPHSGENRVRIKQLDYSGKPRYTKEKSFRPRGVTGVSFSYEKSKKKVFFTEKTHFEIFNEYGNLVKKGYSDSVEVARLDKGVYYINYDSSFGESFKK
ncbi:MAG: hypothetical protein AAF487_09190 [Bacteroidota bacterium]